MNNFTAGLLESLPETMMLVVIITAIWFTVRYLEKKKEKTLVPTKVKVPVVVAVGALWLVGLIGDGASNTPKRGLAVEHSDANWRDKSAKDGVVVNLAPERSTADGSKARLKSLIEEQRSNTSLEDAKAESSDDTPESGEEGN